MLKVLVDGIFFRINNYYITGLKKSLGSSRLDPIFSYLAELLLILFTFSFSSFSWQVEVQPSFPPIA